MTPVSGALPGIREWIFQNGTGNVTALYGNPNYYGSYQVLGNLTVDVGLGSGNVSSVSDYKMAVDLETAVYTSGWTVGDVRYQR